MISRSGPQRRSLAATEIPLFAALSLASEMRLALQRWQGSKSFPLHRKLAFIACIAGWRTGCGAASLAGLDDRGCELHLRLRFN